MWKRDRSLCCCFAEALIWINPGQCRRIVYWRDEIQRICDALLMVLLLCETSPAADASRRERGTV
jgi:hypothetical protein